MTLQFVGNEGTYIVWVKGKKVTHKNLQVECFASTLREGFTHETLVKLITKHNSLTSSHVLLMWLFHGLASRELDSLTWLFSF